jgi:hypothetical protein
LPESSDQVLSKERTKLAASCRPAGPLGTDHVRTSQGAEPEDATATLVLTFVPTATLARSAIISGIDSGLGRNVDQSDR